MLEVIKNHKMFFVFVLLVFAPTSKLVFGFLGFASGLVNWGIVVLAVLVFGAVKGKDMFVSFMNEEDDEEVEFDPFR